MDSGHALSIKTPNFLGDSTAEVYAPHTFCTGNKHMSQAPNFAIHQTILGWNNSNGNCQSFCLSERSVYPGHLYDRFVFQRARAPLSFLASKIQ